MPFTADYGRLCPHFNGSNAKEVAHWGRDPTLVQRVFYAFIFQDALCFGAFRSYLFRAPLKSSSIAVGSQ